MQKLGVGSGTGQLGPWTTRTVDNSARGLLGPWITRTVDYSARLTARPA
jgi:hypothetical protein